MSTQTSTSSAQGTLSLPKGGGAIQGIGETFQANPFSGTANHSLPIALSPGRQGFGPKLSLDYSSGNGNGVFGLGWQLSLPRITRKTEHGLPRYDDSDVFLLSGAEDLVRSLQQATDPATGETRWQPVPPISRDGFSVFLYRPRTEGLFARIERWVDNDSGETHWRTISKDNLTSLYGRTAAARVADPANPLHVHDWLLQETFDALGNHSLCEYAADDPALFAESAGTGRLPEVYERHRQPAQRYLRRLFYGNLPATLADAQGQPLTHADGSPIGVLRDGRRYAFEAVFDHGDWVTPTTLPHPAPPPEGQCELFGANVPLRADRFSHFRAGFEIRTLRRCERVLMFHHFAELGGPTLVRSTDLGYHTDTDTLASLLVQATVTGHQRDEAGAYRSASMPPVVFDYAAFTPHAQHYQPLQSLGGQLPGLPLSDPNMALVDLFGDGLPDLLHTGPDGFRYWRNLGNGLLDRPRTLTQMPAGLTLDQPGVAFGDMAGNGTADLLVNAGPLPGYYETTPDGSWQRFKPFQPLPAATHGNANLRLLDLTGDGRADALLLTDTQFIWYECLGEQGFAPARAIARRHDLDDFPDVFFDDPDGRVRLADMSGDGLNDILLLHNGRVDYWPNLGYGRFGARITMANAPQLPADFDPRRLLLADLTGTGCADLVYVDTQRVHFWFNQNGNAWSEKQTLTGTPRTTDATALTFADVLGSGTATLVWSEALAGQSMYRALDFCGGVKPYVLVGVDNSMGASTRVSYGSSTQHYLRDRAAGQPWITPLPFPVQVVDSVETIDHIGLTRLLTSYQYHHGFFDGREREFRGFGRVDQFDAESFDADSAAAHQVPPVETRSWFHTGLYVDQSGSSPLDAQQLSERYRQEFYAQDSLASPMPAHQVETGDTPHEAYRALRGASLRTEVYGRDGSARAGHPYLVTESRHAVQQLQPQQGNAHAVYLPHALEQLSYHCERNPADPRIAHSLTLQVDDFGNPLKTLAIAYGRRQPDASLPTPADQAQQTQTLITYSEARFTNALADPLATPDHHRAPVPCEALAYELTGFTPADAATGRFSLAEWLADDFALLANAATLGYEQLADGLAAQKRLLSHSRTFYRADDLASLLPLGTLATLALPGETRQRAFTAGLLAQVFGERVDAALLAEAGHVQEPDDPEAWWRPSGRVFCSPMPGDAPATELAFAQQHFFMPQRAMDAFGNISLTRHDAYALLPVETEDALGNLTQAAQDYRVLQASRLTDPNGNRAEVVFDTLGLVVGSAVMGKVNEVQGDSLVGFEPDLDDAQRAAFLADPLGQAAALLGSASTRIVYDLARYQRERQPVLAATLSRETHASEAGLQADLRVQLSLAYSDGLGRQVQQKRPAEPGPLSEGGPEVSPRWVGSGWTIFNNKGQPVQQFEPFFDDGPTFRFAQQVGVSATLFHDPLQRVVATLHPNHSWEKVVFSPWQQASWDVNDTVAIGNPAEDPDVGPFFKPLGSEAYLPTWYDQRQGGDLGDAEQAAASQAAVHANTPAIAYADALGRSFLTLAHNRQALDGEVTEQIFASRTRLDIEGQQREVSDALGRAVMRFDSAPGGTQLHQASMEAGERWLLPDVAGQPVCTWDSRGHRVRTVYDALRRPLQTWLQTGAGAPATQLVSEIVYGESAPTPEADNLRGKPFQQRDTAGLTAFEAYDFKGNLLRSRRQFVADYTTTPDWSAAPALLAETFVSETRYDALNRPVALLTPDGSVSQPQYNLAGLLEAMAVQLPGADQPTPFVTSIRYDAKGQRSEIRRGNGLQTRLAYDPLTWRLVSSQTLRGSDVLQALAYTYDPAGNLTHVQDDAQQTLYFNGQVVTPSNDYVYDALYRLLQAQGREHIGQVSQPQSSWNDAGRVNLPHPNDGQAMRRYTERYAYDAVGNFLQLQHQASNGDWTRSYAYSEASLLEPDKPSNRLSSVTVGSNAPELYPHDAHGNITAMPHLARMAWDFRDQLQSVDLGGGGLAYYAYDASGQRVRKVVVKNGGNLVEERLTLGGFERFQRRNAQGDTTLERQTLHVMDDQQRIALIETRTVGNETEVPAQLLRYQLGNQLGSATLETDATSQIISYEEYYPYGSTSYQAGRSQTETSLKRYRYTGMERDEETGLNCHGARYYAPWLGRWASCDPSSLIDGPNLYQYARSNPISFTDITGHDSNDTITAGPLKVSDIEVGNINAKLSFSGSLSNLFSGEPLSFSVHSADLSGGLSVSAKLAAPSLNLKNGIGLVNLDLSHFKVENHQMNVDFKMNAGFDLGPASLSTSVSGSGLTAIAENISQAEWKAEAQKSVDAGHGQLEAFSTAKLWGIEVGFLAVHASKRSGTSIGELALNGRVGIGSLALARATGSGTIAGDGALDLHGRVSVNAPPLAIGRGTWSFNSAKGFGANGYYVGAQAGPTGLNTSADPNKTLVSDELEGQALENAYLQDETRLARQSRYPASTFSARPSIGFTGAKGSSTFSAGYTPLSSSGASPGSGLYIGFLLSMKFSFNFYQHP